MRNEEVVKSFFKRLCRVNSTGSLSCDGVRLDSYSTCIAEFDDSGVLYINLTKYSATTSHHQSLLARHISDNIKSKVVYDIPINTRHIIPNEYN